MKKVLSCLLAVALMLCAVVSVSAEISPEGSISDKYIIIDTIPVPDKGGESTPEVDAPGKVQVDSGEEVTLTANPKDGYKFDHWEFSTGDFDIISGKITDSVLVIKPKGDVNIRVYAHFSPIDTPPTEPTTKPVEKPDPDPSSPITGEGLFAGDGIVVCAASSVVLLAAFAVVVVLKKKENA